MRPKEVVKDILSAIESVRSRAKEAFEAADHISYTRLMGDLYYLEVCLVGETKKLLEELEKKAA